MIHRIGLNSTFLPVSNPIGMWLMMKSVLKFTKELMGFKSHRDVAHDKLVVSLGGTNLTFQIP